MVSNVEAGALAADARRPLIRPYKADPIGTVASVVSLVGTTFSLIRDVRDAHKRVEDAPKMLSNSVKRLTGLEKSLNLVRDTEALQTADVVQEVQAINEVADELKQVLLRMEMMQRKGRGARMRSAVWAGDRDEKQLAEIVSRIDSARGELQIRISVANVGLTGDLEQGFRVAFQTLQDINKKVEEVTGMGLELAKLLRDRAAQQTPDGFIPLTRDDVKRLGLLSLEDAAGGGTTPGTTGERAFYGNITGKQARIMTGNIGDVKWHGQAGRKTAIANNKFGDGLIAVTGDVSGEAAESFMKGFFM